MIGKTASDLVSPELAAKLEQHDREVLESGEVAEVEIDTVTADGQSRSVVSTRFPVLDGAGATIGVGVINQDVTEQRKTEAQLQQAQKMEMVGQLTGGVAHDFNNLLTVILGNAELLAEYVQDEPDTTRLLQTALDSAQRGADLTQRLLAFSRRQSLEPKSVNVNTQLLEMMPLLQRIMPATISLQTEIADNLPAVHIDPTHLESAIMNLVVNARDAISSDGTIKLMATLVDSSDISDLQKTHSDAKQFVQVSVVDTGEGMTKGVRNHVFEPFFTTKPVGAGSGLGLSMVYGFVSQSGGNIEIVSEPGQGTSVMLYLPIAESPVSEIHVAPPTESYADGAEATILVVEDNADVRDPLSDS